MDIAQPLSTLQKLLENRLHCSLSNHEFYLQDAVKLDIKKNLTTQCVQGSGIVQINVEVKSSPGCKLSNPDESSIDKAACIACVFGLKPLAGGPGLPSLKYTSAAALT